MTPDQYKRAVKALGLSHLAARLAVGTQLENAHCRENSMARSSFVS
jgi:hypothetical protein